LQWLSVIPTGSVKVMVENGWITLSGDVEWKYQQIAAVVAVRYLMGVKGVFDQIHIIPKLSPKSLKSDIENALKRNASEDAKKITVKVDGTDVTLSGKVSNWDERSAIRKSAWAAPGVSKVIDNMVMAY
jgi:osmotically-inducible protein OsmY